jgi:hypothetical protein
VEAVCRLELRPASVWRVFVAVLLTSARYGGRAARLAVADLARMTGLAVRTVKAALTGLQAQGLLAREGRYGRLQVRLGAGGVAGRTASSAPREGAPGPTGGASLRAPPRCTQACTSPTCFYVSSSRREVKEGDAFTARQRAVITDVLSEASELLGSGASDLTFPSETAERFGLAAGMTYGQVQAAVAGSGDARKARDFTRAVLALRRDPRAQGEDLAPDSASSGTALF